ncbi:MAG: F0F1 ATP synthase subunit A [Chloroflexi bacterium]|nr:F0F1 ATP synthase subunit A [Chloroflexota bacterium]
MEELSSGPKTWFHGFAENPLRGWLHAGSDVPMDFVIMTWILCLVLIVVCCLVARNLQRIPGRGQNLLEMLVLRVDTFVREVIGPHGSDYTPFILTLFVFILVGSMLGIVPGFASPTANINTTAALAIVAFLYVNYHAIRMVGFGPFVKGFFPPPLWLAPLLGPLEILSHIIRPLTLAVRLFGNIFGEDVVIVVLALFGLGAFKAWHVPLPLQLPMMLFSLFTDIVQAAVFCMLTTIYISLLTSHGHDSNGDGHDSHAAHGAPAESAA